MKDLVLIIKINMQVVQVDFSFKEIGVQHKLISCV